MKRRTGIGGYIAAIAVGIEPAERRAPGIGEPPALADMCGQGLPRASPEGFTGLTLGRRISRPG